MMGVVVALLMGLLCGGESLSFTIEEREAQVPLGTSISPVGVHSPVGRLLLMRSGSALCVIRFTVFHCDHDAKP